MIDIKKKNNIYSILLQKLFSCGHTVVLFLTYLIRTHCFSLQFEIH